MLGIRMASSPIGGFVLCGGESRRMGQDKAMLELDGSPLVVRIAGVLRFVTEPVTLVGPRNRYEGLGFPVIEDAHRGSGPLSGIVAALEHTGSPRALVVACDLVGLDREFVSQLCRKSLESNGFDAWVGEHPERGIEPLCAVYHVRTLDRLRAHLLAKRLKLRDILKEMRIARVPAADPAIFRNVNTPADWPTTR